MGTLIVRLVRSIRDDESPRDAGTGDQNRSGSKHDGPVFAFDDLFACGGGEEQ